MGPPNSQNGTDDRHTLAAPLWLNLRTATQSISSPHHPPQPEVEGDEAQSTWGWMSAEQEKLRPTEVKYEPRGLLGLGAGWGGGYSLRPGPSEKGWWLLSASHYLAGTGAKHGQI